MTITECYLLTRSKEFTLGPNEEVRIDLKLKMKPFPPKTEVTGRVMSHGSPVLHATIKIMDHKFNPVDHVLTDSGGKYLIVDLQPGDYKATATAPGFLIANIVSFCLRAKQIVVLNFELPEDKSGRTKNYIYGRITEYFSQKAIENAEVKLFAVHSSRPVAEVISNESGQYLFCRIPMGEYFVVASKPGFITSDSVKFIAGEGQFIKIDIPLYVNPLTAAGTVSGLITDPLCPELVDVYVGLFRVEHGGETLTQVKMTISGGLYLFSDVPPGDYVIKAKINDQWKFSSTYKIP